MKFQCDDCGDICELNGLIVYLEDESLATIPFMTDMDEFNVIAYHLDECDKEYMERFNPTWIIKLLNEEVRNHAIDKICSSCLADETLYYCEE